MSTPFTSAAIRGIDVSQVQGDFDWGEAKEKLGLRFAIVKCTQGNDPWGERSRSWYQRAVYSGLSAGLVMGAYHFAYPLPDDGNPKHVGRDPRSQAESFFRSSGGLGSHPGELPPSVDFEWPAYEDWGRWGVNPQQMAQWALDMLSATEALFGRTPFLYTYPWFWGKVGGALRDDFARYRLWMADYDYEEGKTLTPWAAPTLVQVSGGGETLPTGARVDGDVFVGDETAWGRLLL